MNKRQRDALESTVSEVETEAYEKGLRKGLAVAESILGYFETNDQLVSPHSKETLLGWSRDQIDKAKKEIRGA